MSFSISPFYLLANRFPKHWDPIPQMILIMILGAQLPPLQEFLLNCYRMFFKSCLHLDIIANFFVAPFSVLAATTPIGQSRLPSFSPLPPLLALSAFTFFPRICCDEGPSWLFIQAFPSPLTLLAHFPTCIFSFFCEMMRVYGSQSTLPPSSTPLPPLFLKQKLFLILFLF